MLHAYQVSFQDRFWFQIAFFCADVAVVAGWLYGGGTQTTNLTLSCAYFLTVSNKKRAAIKIRFYDRRLSVVRLLMLLLFAATADRSSESELVCESCEGEIFFSIPICICTECTEGLLKCDAKVINRCTVSQTKPSRSSGPDFEVMKVLLAKLRR